MFIVPILLLAALFVVMIGANSMKKKGTMTESGYQTVISVAAVVVTVAALAVMILRLRAK